MISGCSNECSCAWVAAQIETVRNTVAHFTLGEASKEVTASKSTILRAIKSGKLSASKDGDSWRIEASELFRVFDPAPTRSGNHLLKEVEPLTPEPPKLAELEAELIQARTLLEAERERTAELRQDRDRWAAQAERLMLTVVPPPNQSSASRKSGLWARLVDAWRG